MLRTLRFICPYNEAYISGHPHDAKKTDRNVTGTGHVRE